MAPPGRCWPRPPPRCPRPPGASAATTTATPGSATPPSCSGASTPWGSSARPTTSSTSWPTSAARTTSSRSCTGSGSSDETAREEIDHLSSLRGRRAGADRQRRRHPAPARRLGGGAVRSTCASPATTCPSRSWPILKRAVECAIANWNQPDQGIWRSTRPPRHFTSSKLMYWVACDRGSAAMLPRRPRPGRLAQGSRRDPRRHLRARGRRRACSSSTTDPALDAWSCASTRCCGSCPPTTRGSATPCWPSPTS